MKKPQFVLVTTDVETNAQLSKLGVDILEVRIDLFRNKSVDAAMRLLKQRRKLRLPIILTVRSDKKEGAKRTMPEARKWEILQALVPFTDWVDIELSSPIYSRAAALARKFKKKIVLSSHNFAATPSSGRLNQLLTRCLRRKADMVKIVGMTNSPDDLLRLMEFTHGNRKHALVTMGMGQWGPLSRLILPSLGSRWVYTFSRMSPVAGQVHVQELREFFEKDGFFEEKTFSRR